MIEHLELFPSQRCSCSPLSLSFGLRTYPVGSALAKGHGFEQRVQSERVPSLDGIADIIVPCGVADTAHSGERSTDQNESSSRSEVSSTRRVKRTPPRRTQTSVTGGGTCHGQKLQHERQFTRR